MYGLVRVAAFVGLFGTPSGTRDFSLLIFVDTSINSPSVIQGMFSELNVSIKRTSLLFFFLDLCFYVL